MRSLRWQQPGTVAADFWRVYRDGGLLVDQVAPAADASGVRETPLPSHPAAADYTMKAVNAVGESPASNVLTLPEPPEALGLVVVLAALPTVDRLRRRAPGWLGRLRRRFYCFRFGHLEGKLGFCSRCGKRPT